MTTLRIDVPDRADAVDMSRRVGRFRTFLVQDGREHPLRVPAAV